MNQNKCEKNEPISKSAQGEDQRPPRWFFRWSYFVFGGFLSVFFIVGVVHERVTLTGSPLFDFFFFVLCVLGFVWCDISTENNR